MADFHQHGPITTLHDLQTVDLERLETVLTSACRDYRIGLILPTTASDMRAAPFANIVKQLVEVKYLHHIIVVLGMAPDVDDYYETRRIIEPLGSRAQILWTDGRRTQDLYSTLEEAEIVLGAPGKGRAVWTAFGYLAADPSLNAYVLQDCDIVSYDRTMLARLCLPMAHPSLDFEFCKAYYARCTDRLHGRVVRLLVSPLIEALIAVLGHSPFLSFMESFRYPLAGEFALSASLARSNRIPSDWGLEVGTLAEVYRNLSPKKVCQVDLCCKYEHKHQDLSLDDPNKGLMKMARDILTTMFRTLASMGMVLEPGHFNTIRSAYVRAAQDAIRQYHADALINGLELARHTEEHAVDGFADQIMVAGEAYQNSPSGSPAIPNWARIVSLFPDFPQRLRAAAEEDARELSA
ncbi:MAG: glycosyl transferase [Pirellulales bacterium]